MSQHFEQDGLRFQYPENWQLERDDADSGWSVHLQSPGSSFLLISVDTNLTETDQVLQSALEAVRSEYTDIEVNERLDTIAGLPAPGYDIQFTSLDLVISGYVRGFQTDDATVLLMWQTPDVEETEPVLRAICASFGVTQV